MLRLFSIISVMLIAGQTHAFQCRRLFITADPITIVEQIRQVKNFEQVYLKRNPRKVTTNLNYLGDLLSVLQGITAQVTNEMSPYHGKRSSLAAALPRYLKTRLGALSVEEQIGMQDVLASVRWINSKFIGEDLKKDFTGAYVPDDRHIFFEMPPHYKGTLLHAFIFAHELEHAIQHTRLLNTLNVEGVSERAGVEIRYSKEVGAMTAEWVFLQGVSNVEINFMLEEVEKAKDIHVHYRTFFLRAFRNARLPLKDYIHQEQLAGRYDHDWE